MRAIQVRCPQCGAGLDVGDHDRSVTCQYCGTVSRVQARSRIFQVPQRLPPETGQPRPVARQRVNRAAVFIPLIMTFGIMGLVAFISWRAFNAVKIPNIQIPSTGKTTTGKTTYPDQWSGDPVVVVDVDGDGAEELVGFTRNVQDGDRYQLAAFRAADGKAVWSTDRLGTHSDMSQSIVAVAGDAILVTTAGGQLLAFEQRTGAPRWSVSLGEKAAAMCSEGEAGVIALETADKAWHRVALADGALAERKEPLVVDTRSRNGKRVPIKWVSGELPPGMCMWLADNDDDRAAGLATADHWSGLPTIKGLSIGRMVRRGAGPVVALGTKYPGSPVPTLAVVEGTRVVWSQAVPAADPLTARFDDKNVYLGADAAYVVYQGEHGYNLTAMSLDDGHRLWDQPLQVNHSLVVTGVRLAGGVVAVSSWGNLQVFDAATGAPRYVIGRI